MLHNIKKRNEGFTIIEVMIVLAIAGLIMLIVFLAVPALQRNSRNTQSHNDSASILAAANEYTNNNNGTLPVAANSAAILALTKTRNITNLTIVTGSVAVQTPTLTTAILDTGVKCGAVGGANTTPVAGPTRAMALIYAVENAAGGVVTQCTDS